jgi:Spy/CpxP family protein refolding chaperone
MKRVMTVATLGVLLCGGVSAQEPRRGPRPGDGSGGPPIEMLKERLGLSDDQVAQIQAFQEKNAETNKAIFDAARKAHEAFDQALNADAPDPTSVGQLAIAMRVADKKVEAIRQAERDELKSILTPEQLQKLEQGPRGFGPGPGAPRRREPR